MPTPLLLWLAACGCMCMHACAAPWRACLPSWRVHVCCCCGRVFVVWMRCMVVWMLRGLCVACAWPVRRARCFGLLGAARGRQCCGGGRGAASACRIHWPLQLGLVCPCVAFVVLGGCSPIDLDPCLSFPPPRTVHTRAHLEYFVCVVGRWPRGVFRGDLGPRAQFVSAAP